MFSIHMSINGYDPELWSAIENESRVRKSISS